MEYKSPKTFGLFTIDIRALWYRVEGSIGRIEFFF
jgi:hypothetical protein